jgi:hypothetical protein
MHRAPAHPAVGICPANNKQHTEHHQAHLIIDTAGCLTVPGASSCCKGCLTFESSCGQLRLLSLAVFVKHAPNILQFTCSQHAQVHATKAAAYHAARRSCKPLAGKRQPLHACCISPSTHLSAPASFIKQQVATLGHNRHNIREGPHHWCPTRLLLLLRAVWRCAPAAAAPSHFAADVCPHAFAGVSHCCSQRLNKPAASRQDSRRQTMHETLWDQPDCATSYTKLHWT